MNFNNKEILEGFYMKNSINKYTQSVDRLIKYFAKTNLFEKYEEDLILLLNLSVSLATLKEEYKQENKIENNSTIFIELPDDGRETFKEDYE